MSDERGRANGAAAPTESSDDKRRATVFQQIEAILDCEDYTASQKCLILKIRCRVDGRSLKDAFISNEGLMRAASIEDWRTLRAELRELEGKSRAIPKDKAGRRIKDRIDLKRALIVREERSGKATAFAFTSERLQAIVDAYMESRKGSVRPPASGAPPASHAPSASHADHPLHSMQGDPLHPMQTDPFPPDVYPEDSPGADAPEPVDDDDADEETPSKLTKAEIEAGFDEWWQHYPRREDKGDAQRAYCKCVTHKDPRQRATIAQLLAAVKACRWPTERRFTKLPATWLNKGSWQDVSVAAPAPLTAPPPDLDDRSGRLHAVLERRVGATVYGSWLTTLRVESLEGDRLTVSVATPFQRDWITQKLDEAMTDAGRAAFGTVQRVDVTVRKATP